MDKESPSELSVLEHSFSSGNATRKKDLLASFFIWGSVLIVAGFFVWFLFDIVSHGYRELSWAYLTSPIKNAGRSGGIGPILVSTSLILLVCITVSIPLGFGTAVFLSEFTSTESFFGRMVRRSLDVLSGVPSIVFGLFGNVFFCKVMGLGFSILSGGLTLACMVLPILIRASEEGLRSVPMEYRTGAAALGFSQSTTVFSLLIPSALPGLLVGIILGLGRAAAETAALIFTSGYVDRMPSSLMDSGRALSVHIFDLSMNVSGGDAKAYAASLVLVISLLVINILSNTLSERWLHKRIVTV